MRKQLIGRLIVAATLVMAVSASADSGYSNANAQRYQRAQDWTGLLKYAQAWTQAEPNDPSGWAYLSVAYFFGMHRPDLALSPAERSASLDPNNSEGWNGVAAIYAAMRRWPDAIAATNHAIRIDPRDTRHWLHLAIFYLDSNQPQQARQALDQMQQHCVTAEDFERLGQGESEAGNPPRAVAAYQRAIQLSPGNGAHGTTWA